MTTEAIYSVLIVEDEMDFLELYCENFQESPQFKITTLSSGQDALKIVDNQRFDAIILDLTLPEATGLEVASAIRNSLANRTTLIYMVSGNLDENVRIAAQDLGIAETKTKPLNFRDFVHELENALQSRQLVAIDPALVNICIDCCVEVMEYYLHESLLVGRPKMLQINETEPAPHATAISFKGPDFEGTIINKYDHVFGKKVAAGLESLGSQEMSINEQGLPEALLEISNQIAGRLKRNFARFNIEVSIGLPQTMQDSSLHTPCPQVLTAKIGTQEARGSVELSLSKADLCLPEKLDDDSHANGLFFFG